MSNLIFVRSDDWEGVYLNNKLVMQGHSLSVSELVSLLDGECLELDEEWMNEKGWLPTKFSDCELSAKYYSYLNEYSEGHEE